MNEEERECAICLVEYVLNDKLKVLPCLHKYHDKCISEWLLKGSSCPFCHYELW